MPRCTHNGKMAAAHPRTPSRGGNRRHRWQTTQHAGGHNIVTAVTTPSQHDLGCELVADKSNEIPAARKLVGRLDLDSKLVSPDALHSGQQTAREIVLEAGAVRLVTSARPQLPAPKRQRTPRA